MKLIVTLFILPFCIACGDTDTRDDTTSSRCGNEIVNTDEFCDSSAVACTQIDPVAYSGGFAVCNNTCSGWDTGGCVPLHTECGDNVREGKEYCDGDCIPCSEADPSLTGGDACCNDECTGYTAENCITRQKCGNGELEGDELCELGQFVSCSSLAPDLFHSGWAPCGEECGRWDVSKCTPLQCVGLDCGNVLLNFNDYPILYSCGSCAEGTLCSTDHYCIDPCEDVSCGQVTVTTSDGVPETVSCGSCDSEEYCTEDNFCTTACENMACGMDHGMYCGTCPAGEYCSVSFHECHKTPEHGTRHIPAGDFFMGCNPVTDPYCGRTAHSFADEHPYRQVTVSGFTIMTYEVTISDYRACIDAGVCDNTGERKLYNSSEYNPYCAAGSNLSGDYPMNCVNWYGADTYCSWIGMRLPTEAEWEKAARGGCEFHENCHDDTFIYPWGNTEASCDYAVMEEAETEIPGCGTGSTHPVGNRPAGRSIYGLYDCAGNVWEWTADWYDYDYFESAPDTDPAGPETGTEKVIKGGSCTFSPWVIRSSYRHGLDPETFYTFSGFRCVRDSN